MSPAALLLDDLRWLNGYRQRNPKVRVTYPSDSEDETWLVTLPHSRPQKFAQLDLLRRTLEECDYKNSFKNKLRQSHVWVKVRAWTTESMRSL